MATTVDAKAIAGTLYEALIGTALEQLRGAAPKLVGSGGDMGQRVEAALPEGALPQVRNFLLGLAREGLLNDVNAVTEAFAGFVSGPPVQIIDAEVTSAVALTPAQQAAIGADLKQRYGEVSVSFDVDESLIGGLIIRVGDQVLDNSLRTRLSAIQRNMIAS